MKPTYPHISRTGPTVTIEARTMAEADAAAEAELGPGFSVTSVRRLRKGGVGGFFASVLVEMVATAPGAAPHVAEPEMATAEELLRGLQRHEGDFAARLLDRIGDIDPDTMTLQQLMAAGRAGGLPIEAWDDVPWDMRSADAPSGQRLADVADAPTYTGGDRSATNELPAVADSIGPDPLGIDGPPLQRRQPRSTAVPGPLDEMPPPPLRFDEDTGRWTLAPPGSVPVDEVGLPPLGDAPAVPSPPELIFATPPEWTAAPTAPPPPTPAAWSAPTLPAPAPAPTVAVAEAAPAPIVAAPIGAAPVEAAPEATTSEPAAPFVPAATTSEPATVESAVVEPVETFEPAATTSEPAAILEAEPDSEPIAVALPRAPASLAEAGWIIDLDTPEPVLGAAVLGPRLPTDVAPVDTAIDALTALPELPGPVVNAVAPETAIAPEATPIELAAEPVDSDIDLVDDIEASIDLTLADVEVAVPADRLDEVPDPDRSSAAAAPLGTGLESLRARTRPTVAWRSRPLPIEAVDEPASESAAPADAAAAPTAARAEAPAPEPEPATPEPDAEPEVVVPQADAQPNVVTPAWVPEIALPGTVAAFAAPALGPDRPAVNPSVSFQPPSSVRTFQALLPEVELAVAPDGIGDGWSARALQALGLPDRLVQVASGLAPRDDAEWTAALVLALRPLFGPVPEGRTLLAGPAVAAVAEQLGARSVAAGAVADEALVVLETEDPAEVAATLDGRRFHLVVGGMWHELARLQPALVSAAGPRFLLPAVAVAHAWGVPLGVIAAPNVARLDAVTVAMDIRATLGLDGDRLSAIDHRLRRP